MSYPPPPDDGDPRPTAQQPAQPQYGQPAPQYGQPAPQYGQPYTPAAPVRERTFGVASIVWTLLGAIAAVVGLFAVRWLEVENSQGAARAVGSEPKFLDLRKVFVSAADLPIPDKPDWTIAYFEYGAFVLLGVTLVLAVLAALPTPATGVLRILGFVVGLVSAAAAILIPKLDGGDLDDYLNGGLGLYIVAGGSLLMAIGALIGSKRRT